MWSPGLLPPLDQFLKRSVTACPGQAHRSGMCSALCFISWPMWQASEPWSPHFEETPTTPGWFPRIPKRCQCVLSDCSVCLRTILSHSPPTPVSLQPAWFITPEDRYEVGWPPEGSVTFKRDILGMKRMIETNQVNERRGTKQVNKIFEVRFAQSDEDTCKLYDSAILNRQVTKHKKHCRPCLLFHCFLSCCC